MTIAVRVQESRKNREFLRLLRQMPDRLNGFSFYLSYQAAVALREELLAKIPDSPDYDVYRNRKVPGVEAPMLPIPGVTDTKRRRA